MENQENKMCFKTKSLGELQILALVDNCALIEKMYDTPEKYIIANGFDMKIKSWNFGSYYEEFKEALEDFTDRVLSNRHIESSKQTMLNKLYDLGITMKELTNNFDNSNIQHEVVHSDNEVIEYENEI